MENVKNAGEFLCVFCVTGGRNFRSQTMHIESYFVRMSVTVIPRDVVISLDFTANSGRRLEKQRLKNESENSASQKWCGVVDKTRLLRKM